MPGLVNQRRFFDLSFRQGDRTVPYNSDYVLSAAAYPHLQPIPFLPTSLSGFRMPHDNQIPAGLTAFRKFNFICNFY